MAEENELSAVYAVYASMQADLLTTLVHRGALDPADGGAIVQRALNLLSQAPWQGAMTDAAAAGLRDLQESISPRVRDLKRP